jgi:23S rRNA pseudouridine2457 synthase
MMNYFKKEGSEKKKPALVNPQLLSYYAIYKPFGTISQFTKEGAHPTLDDLGFKFPKDAYPVGRLDTNSEGLLILTNDKSLNALLLNPQNAHERTYWAQVEGAATKETMKLLSKGITITVDGKSYQTLPCKAKLLEEEPSLPERHPPIRFRANIPTSWVELTLKEGKNHQVRKMCAKAGFPVLRLVRVRIGKIKLNEMQPGEVIKLSLEQFGLKGQ